MGSWCGLSVAAPTCGDRQPPFGCPAGPSPAGMHGNFRSVSTASASSITFRDRQGRARLPPCLLSWKNRSIRRLRWTIGPSGARRAIRNCGFSTLVRDRPKRVIGEMAGPVGSYVEQRTLIVDSCIRKIGVLARNRFHDVVSPREIRSTAAAARSNNSP
jgi:hypothetical protein